MITDPFRWALLPDRYKGTGPEGADVVSAESAEWSTTVEPLGSTVDCGSCGRRVPDGKCCGTCHHGCSMPGDPKCPGRE